MTAETITTTEIKSLLKEAASRDQRTTDKADIIAWYQDLNVAGVRYADASAALSHYYAEIWPKQDPKLRFRATAPVIIEIVRKIREKRHEAAGFIYEPVAGETGAEYAIRRRQQLRAVGDGRHPVYSAHVLSHDVDEHKRRLAELVSGVDQRLPLPPEISDILAPCRTGPKSIRCPKCSAGPKSGCTNGNGKPMAAPHPARVDAHAVQTADCPECHVTAGEGCREMGEPYPGGAHPGRVRAVTADRSGS
jgi:hypothetical protein